MCVFKGMCKAYIQKALMGCVESVRLKGIDALFVTAGCFQKSVICWVSGMCVFHRHSVLHVILRWVFKSRSLVASHYALYLHCLRAV